MHQSFVTTDPSPREGVGIAVEMREVFTFLLSPQCMRHTLVCSICTKMAVQFENLLDCGGGDINRVYNKILQS